MTQEEQLKEEVEFWLNYINEWKMNRKEPVPKRALTLLENALIKLNLYYSEHEKHRPQQAAKHSVH